MGLCGKQRKVLFHNAIGCIEFISSLPLPVEWQDMNGIQEYGIMN